ncbi:MAG: hypothetical protein ABI852_20190 [Gemmatimonadaceae bacterium]
MIQQFGESRYFTVKVLVPLFSRPASQEMMMLTLTLPDGSPVNVNEERSEAGVPDTCFVTPLSRNERITDSLL